MPSLTVAQNIGLPLRLDGRRARRAEVRDVAARVGLENRLRHRPAQLSGGQQQRVAIARALITRPEVVFADEPTGALDRRTGRGVLALLREVVDADGHTVVMVTHDPVAAAHADRVVLLADGRIAGRLEAPPPTRSPSSSRTGGLTDAPSRPSRTAAAASAPSPAPSCARRVVRPRHGGRHAARGGAAHAAPVERYAAAAAVVTGQQMAGEDGDVPLGESASAWTRATDRPAGRRPRRARPPRRRVGRPRGLGGRGRRPPTAGQRGPHPVRLRRRTPPPAAPARSSTATPRARRAPAPRVHRSGPHGHRGRLSPRPLRPVRRRRRSSVTDGEAPRLAGHPGRVDAIGVLAGRALDPSRLRARRRRRRGRAHR
jgi:energy-coupling factor transporter ATP-binding protein EcfA2